MNNYRAFLFAVLKAVSAVVMSAGVLYLFFVVLNGALTQSPALGLALPLYFMVVAVVYFFVPIGLLFGTVVSTDQIYHSGTSLLWLPFVALVPVVGPLSFFWYRRSADSRPVTPRRSNSVGRIALVTAVLAPAMVTNAVAYHEAGRLVDVMLHHVK